MNVVREINKINELELDLGISGASWHDEYKDSAYVFVGGLHFDLTEGDVITIMSQYGEVMDINMPRSKETGKTRGFAFVMYEDQRSTILAVDNLNGAKVLEKTLRVDHVKNYKQGRTKGEDGEWIEPEEQSLNAKPEIIAAESESESSGSDAPDIDPDDPMRDYLLQKWRDEKKEKKAKKSKSKGKHKDETPEERRARKERKRQKKARRAAGKSEGLKGVEALLQSLDQRVRPASRDASRSASPRRRRRSDDRSISPEGRYRRKDDDDYGPRSSRRSPPRSPSPRRSRQRSDSGERWADRHRPREVKREYD
ncbi:RNA-binding domain-containing protein [Dentipellis sp. KUC8613]|nr:RNA-binding domain-containing protein [Dentipellis sp. KUC8613]